MVARLTPQVNAFKRRERPGACLASPERFSGLTCRAMQRWLPPLSTADLVVLGTTLVLIFSASKIGAAAKLLERMFRGRR
jgi:hypothetical protein